MEYQKKQQQEDKQQQQKENQQRDDQEEKDNCCYPNVVKKMITNNGLYNSLNLFVKQYKKINEKESGLIKILEVVHEQ